MLGAAQGIEADWQKRTGELWATSPFKLEGEAAGSLSLSEPSDVYDEVAAPESAPDTDPFMEEDEQPVPASDEEIVEEAPNASETEEDDELEAPEPIEPSVQPEEAPTQGEVEQDDPLQDGIPSELDEEEEWQSEVLSPGEEPDPVSAQWEPDLSLEPEPLSGVDDDFAAADGLPPIDAWNDPVIGADGIVSEIPTSVVHVDEADYMEVEPEHELEAEVELEPEVELVDEEVQPTPRAEEPVPFNNTVLFEAQSEVELILKPLADMSRIVKFYGQLQNLDGLRVKSTSGSWDRGTTINLVLDRPLPLYQLFSQLQNVEARPSESESDGLLSSVLSQFGPRHGGKARIDIAFLEGDEPEAAPDEPALEDSPDIAENGVSDGSN